MKKIAVACNSLGVGGLEIFVLNLIKGLQKINKYEIVLICICGGGLEKRFEETGIEIRTGGWKEQYEDIDLIVVNAAGHGYAMGKSLGKPIVEVVHSVYCLDLPKDISQVITVNDELINSVVSMHGQLSCPMEAVSIGVDTDYFTPQSVEDDIFTIGMSGRLASIKRPHELTKIFQQAFFGTNAKLLYIGDGEERQSIENDTKIHNLNCEITGMLDDIRGRMAELDVYCTLSTYESFSISTLEAMAMGKCIIATRTDGIMRLLTDDSAILIQKDNATLHANVKNALELAKTELANGNARGKKARERAETIFSMDAMINKHAEIYDRILNG